MTLKSKNTILSLLAGVALMVFYVIFALSDQAPAGNDVKGWAQSMVLFIGIGIGLIIIIQILFYIIAAIGISAQNGNNDRSANKIIISELVESNEMDKLITYKSAHIGYGICGVGIVAGLIALAFGAPVVPSLHITVGSLALSGITEGIISVIYYEKGIK